MLYILLGENGYTRRQFLTGLKAELGLADSDVVVLAGAQLSPAQLANAVNTIPFLAPSRLVVVEGLLDRFEPRKRAQETGPRGLLQEFSSAAQPGIPTTTLVLVDEKVSPQNPLRKALSSVAQVREFPPLKKPELLDWIREEIAKRGGKIDPGAVLKLAEAAANDQWSLSNEIDKLLLYSEGKTIQEKAIKEVVALASETNVFHLVDALLQRRSVAASRWLHELLANGMAAGQLISLVARQLRLVLLAKEFQTRRLTEQDIQQRLGLQDFQVRRTLAQAREYTAPQLVQAYELLMETDIAIKTGRQEDEVALDILVAEMSRNRKR